jgi:hypothetical protein
VENLSDADKKAIADYLARNQWQAKLT